MRSDTKQQLFSFIGMLFKPLVKSLIQPHEILFTITFASQIWNTQVFFPENRSEYFLHACIQGVEDAVSELFSAIDFNSDGSVLCFMCALAHWCQPESVLLCIRNICGSLHGPLWFYFSTSNLTSFSIWSFLAFFSKIELWELQRYLWTQFSSRLSDEYFDQLTLGRRNCDPADGSLSKTTFLDLANSLLASSSTSSGMATYKPKNWPLVGKILKRSARAFKLEGFCEDFNQEDNIQAEVAQ